MRTNIQQKQSEQRYEYFLITEEDLLMYKGKLCIPNSTYLNILIMDELQKNPYLGHHAYQKMITMTRKQ